ncbi:MAG TPA: methyltransferase [Thermoleophilaceae bacterium]|nr:methyltransferase [Thermoleophilaceae bacterium]
MGAERLPQRRGPLAGAAALVLGEPDPFVDSFTGLVAARALSTATMLGVFDALHERPASASELGERLSLDPLGAETLLTTLLTMGYVEHGGHGRLRNSGVTERLLVSSSPESIATFVGAQGDLHWQVLGLLPEAVRDGTAYAMHEERRGDAERWEAYIRGLFEISRPEHEANAALVPVEDARRMVDVAGGHGAFSMAMCRRHPALHATVLDLPPSAAVGRRIVAEQGYAERVSFREGDVFELGLGEDLDVVSVFNLVHHLPEERDRELCRMARAALRPGGCLVIGDSARPEPGEQVSEHGAISSLLFYAWSHSRNFTPSEIRSWMREAGFREVETHRNVRSPWRIVLAGR